MGKSKKKQKLMLTKLKKEEEKEEISSKIPIPNLPNKFLWMHVKSGTKIRNVLGYALKEFANHENCVVWTGAGQGVGKAISCAELFKSKHQGLHQITRLRYIKSKKASQEPTEGKEGKKLEVPEIHILLAQEVKDTTIPGYQAPDDPGYFVPQESTQTPSTSRNMNNKGGNNSKTSYIDAEKFATMGLRMGQKRPKNDNSAGGPSKKNKK